MLNSIAGFLERSAKNSPRKTAVIYKGKIFSYKEFDEKCNKIANALIAKGLKKGDKVVVSTKNKLLESLLCFGILKAGAVEIALDPTDTTKNVESTMRLTDARFTISDKDNLDFLYEDNSANPPKIEFNQNDIAFIQPTSGSTGAPKNVVLTHGNFIVPISENKYVAERSNDTLFLQMPLCYAYSKSVLLEYVSAGATIHLSDKIILPQEAFKFIKTNKITALEGPPSFYEALLRFSGFAKEELVDLKYISIGGGGASPRLVEALRKAQKQPVISNRYGLSETASVVTRIEFKPGEPLEKIGSCGTVAPYAKIRIVDGEILVKGQNVMQGYYGQKNDSDASLKDGWLFTGDIGEMDSDGYLFITSRKSQIIKSQGYRISPVAVEEVLMKIAGIESAACIGIPNEIFGEIVKALIVRNDEALKEVEIASHCNKHLPGFMVPRVVQFIEKMPYTGNGKIDRKSLRNNYR